MQVPQSYFYDLICELTIVLGTVGDYIHDVRWVYEQFYDIGAPPSVVNASARLPHLR